MNLKGTAFLSKQTRQTVCGDREAFLILYIMGCDIHMFAEVKKNGKWEKIVKKFKNRRYDPNRESKTDEDGYEWNPEFHDHPYSGRNYDLFGILADVRNGRGFAGIKTGEGFVPISEPKGLPEDVSGEIKKDSDDYGYDGHSHSYFTLKELKSYDWSRNTAIYGVVTKEEFLKLKSENKTPTSYCGWVSGQNIIVVSEQDFDQHKDYLDKEVYVQMQWSESYKEASGNFLERISEQLEPFGSDEDVRIVFWFDN